MLGFGRALGAFVAIVMISGCSGSNSPPSAFASERPLVGTWRVAAYVNPAARDSAGAFPLGRSPLGYLVYDRTGHVFFHVVSGVAAQPGARGRWQSADSAALGRLLSDAAAYFGTYTADYSRGTVVHHIEGETPPNIGTTEVATPFRVNGDTLILGRDSVRHWRFMRVR
jgi:hypothetical protein